MSDILLFLAALGISWVGFYFYYKVLGKEKQQQASSPNNTNNNSMSNSTSNNKNNDTSQQQQGAEFDTRLFCIELLKKVNCEVTIDEEDPDHLSFMFQGAPFHIDTCKGYLLICIWNTWWGTFDLNDLDEVARVRKAINIINTNSNLTMLYSIDEENQKVVVHTKRTCLLIPEIPNTDQYLIAMLTGFFDIQRHFKEVLDNLRNEENAEK